MTQPPEGDFPPVHPSGGDQTAFTRPDWLLRLPNFLIQLIEKIVGLVVQAITGIFLPGPIGSAFNQLTAWAEGLTDSILGPLVDLLVTVFDSIPIIGPPIGNAIEDLAALLGLVKDTADVANTPENPAIVDLAGRLNASTGGWSDNFDRSSVGSDWTIHQGTVSNEQTDGMYDYIQGSSTTTADVHRTANQFGTAQQYAQMRIRWVQSGSVALIIMGNNGLLSVGVGVRMVDPAFTSGGNMLQIVSATGPDQPDLTVEDEVDIGRVWQINDVLGIGFSTASETYVAYLNDTPLCNFHDPGAATVPITGRDVHCLANVNGGFSGNRGAGFDNVTAYDWT